MKNFAVSSILPKLNTKQRVEFADVRRQVSLQQLTDYLAIQLVKQGEAESRGQCPLCQKDQRSLAVNFAKGYFRCFNTSCPVNGSGVIDFLAKTHELTSVTAAHIIAYLFKLPPYRGEGPENKTDGVAAPSAAATSPSLLEAHNNDLFQGLRLAREGDAFCLHYASGGSRSLSLTEALLFSIAHDLKHLVR